jgi:L-alanine-DL-glutamate epimerase-like enolase superfamily enzyme
MSRLAKLEVLHFRHPLVQPVTTVMGPMTHRPALLLRIEDAEGAEGWGEIWCNFPPGGDLHRARLAINVLPHALAGLEAEEAPFETIRTRLRRLSIQAGEPGPVAQLAAGADIALHDLRARRKGVPLARLLGGAPRRVPAYASGIDPGRFEAQYERMRGLGYRRFKQRIGFGADDSLPQLEEAAAALREGELLMADANQAWDARTAIARADRLSPLHLQWLEEPICADEPVADWQAVANAAPMPLAGGENIGHRADFSAAIASGVFGFMQPDICKWGGLSGAASVAREAEAAGLTYCPHFLGGGVGLVASAHLLAAIGGEGVLEVDSQENPLLAHFSGRGLALEDGTFPLSGAAGLGYVPDVAGAADLLASREERRLR